MNLTELKNKKKMSIRKSSLEQLLLIPGVWVNGNYFWVQDQAEKVIYDEELIIRVKQEQIHSKIRMSTVYVSNHSDQAKDVKILAMHQYPLVTGEQLTFVSPSENRIFHLADKNVYMVNGAYNGTGLGECTVMPQWNIYTDQIWSSLSKGSLKYQPMVKGLAGSIFTFQMKIEKHKTNKFHTWTIGGANKTEVLALEKALFKNTLAFPSEK